MSSTEGNRRYKLPKIELKKFNGELTEWLGFWAQFEKIVEDETLHASDKFQYLVQVMVKGTRAWELVDSYPQTAENYPKVIKALKERFGKTELLVEVYARDLHRFVLSNANSGEIVKLSTLYDKLESRLRALESLCTTAETNAVLLFTLVESSLPVETLRAWNRDSLSSRDGSKENPPKNRMDFLLEFLRKEIQSEERIALSHPVCKNEENVKSKSMLMPNLNRSSSEEIPTTSGLHVGAEPCCVFCQKNHYSDKCYNASGMTLEEKQASLRENNCCFVCMKRGHQSKVCRAYIKCILCKEKHTSVMCPELPSNKVEEHSEIPTSNDVRITQSNLSCSSNVILKTLIVDVICPNGEKKKARVLIDDGSQQSYIRKKFANDLGLRSIGEEQMVHSLFGGIKSDARNLRRYILKMKANSKGSKFVKIEALDQQVICGNIERLSAGPWLKELKENKVWLSDIGSEHLEIDILLGADLCGKILTGRTLQLQNGLTVIETILGWTAMGKMEDRSSNKHVSMSSSSMFSPQWWEEGKM